MLSLYYHIIELFSRIINILAISYKIRTRRMYNNADNFFIIKCAVYLNSFFNIFFNKYLKFHEVCVKIKYLTRRMNRQHDFLSQWGDIMICPKCGFNLPNGSMFCGNCGTRLAQAPMPAQPQAAPRPAMPYQQPYRPPVVQQRPPVPAQTPYYPPQAAPAAPSATPPGTAPYGSPESAMRSTLYNPAAVGSLFPYSTGSVQPRSSVSSAQTARSIYSSKEVSSQYMGVTPATFNVEQKDVVIDQGGGNAATIIMTICIILLTAALLYLSGVFDFGSRSTLEPAPPVVPDTTDVQPIHPAETVDVSLTDVSQSDAISVSDITSRTDTPSATDTPMPPADTEPAKPSGGMPMAFGETDFRELNSFLSSFTEVEFLSFSEDAILDDTVRFAVLGLSINSNVFSPLPQPYTSRGTQYNYSIPAVSVFDRIERYFGTDVSGAVKQFDSGKDWLFYQNEFYFIEPAVSKGFALATSYAENGGAIDVTFNIYAPTENDSLYYGLTAAQAQDAGLTVIGTGDAKIVKKDYNGREVYMISAYDVRYNQQ